MFGALVTLSFGLAIVLTVSSSRAFADLPQSCLFSPAEARATNIASYTPVQMICRSSSHDWYAIRKLYTASRESIISRLTHRLSTLD
jgi:hypothetical protein